MAEIHPTALITGDVVLGEDVSVGPYSVLTGPIEVADGVRIGSHCAIGGFADELGTRGPSEPAGPIVIGPGALIRDHVSVHHPFETAQTVLGEGTYLMHGTYVAHDCVLERGATLAQNAAIGGFSVVLESAYVAMGAAVQQRAVVGQFSIVGAATAAVKSLPPFSRLIPGRGLDPNDYAIERYGFGSERDAIAGWLSGNPAPTEGRAAAVIERYGEWSASAGVSEYSRG